MKVALYIRVSTKLQENKFSLSAQKEELTKYAKSQGWEIVNEFKDVDSGGKLDKVGLNALMDFVEDGKCDVVLCIDQDRLSRLDTISWEFLKSTLRDNSVKIAEPGSITDLENEDEEFISDIKNLIAKREKRAIVRRMMRGKRQRTREGKGWGKPPMEYNYDKNTGSYSVNKEWSWLIPYIDDLYLNKGYSDTQIAKELNKISKTPRGRNWSDTHVRQKLRNKAYHGVLEKSFSNGETITVPDIFPQLRTEEEYEQIQEKRKNKFRRRKEEHPQLLRRVNMVCGYCGRKLTIHMSGDPNYSIHFYIEHSRKIRHADGKACEMKINTVRVEQNLINAIKSILTGEDAAKDYLQLDYDQKDLDKLNADIKDANRLKNDAQAKIDRLLPLYLDGGFTKDQLDQQKAILDNQLQLHIKRLQKLQNKKELIQKNMFNYDMVLQYLAVAERFEVLLEKDEQMDLIGNLFPNAVVYGDVIVLSGSLPGDIPIEIRVPVEEDPYQVKVKANGVNNLAAKLTEKEVLAIRENKEEKTYRQLADQYEVSPSAISAIINRQTWTHI